MARFLSSDWLAELSAEASTAKTGPLDDAFAVQQLVTGGPEGDVSWTVRIGNGSFAVQAGVVEDPLVTFTQDYATAVEIHQGTLSAQAAFMTGRLRVSGNVGLLLERQDVLTALDDVFATSRATTTY
ncbi:MAG: SCP2 sterol-binding domain-containing protein [Actinomycetes bacterium]